MYNFIVTCLTYKRKSPPILNMLKENPQLVIWFGVRKEDYDAGFYDEWKENEQVRFILLENVSDAAETRNAIIEFCYKANFKYIIQFDDTITKLKDEEQNSNDVLHCIKAAIELMETEPHDPIAYVFRRFTRYKVRATMIQAWVANTKRLYESGVRFRRIDEVGWDDFVFTYELHERGNFVVASPRLKLDMQQWSPWDAIPGGTHSAAELENYEKTMQRFNNRNKTCLEWVNSHYNYNNVTLRPVHRDDGRVFECVHSDWTFRGE